MPNDPAKAFDHLYAALSEYESRFIDTTVKACGFYLLAMGWLLTSETARGLVGRSGNRTIAIIGLALPAFACALLFMRMIQIIRMLQRELQALDYYPESYYEFRIFPRGVATAMAVIAIFPCVILIAFLLTMKGG